MFRRLAAVLNHPSAKAVIGAATVGVGLKLMAEVTGFYTAEVKRLQGEHQWWTNALAGAERAWHSQEGQAFATEAKAVIGNFIAAATDAPAAPAAAQPAPEDAAPASTVDGVTFADNS